MPIDTRTIPELNLVVHEVKGAIGRDEWTEAATRVLDDPIFRPGVRVCWDFSGIENYNPTAERLRSTAEKMVSLMRAADFHWRTAIWSPSPLVYGLGRMYEVFAEDAPFEIKFFQTREAALEWLGVDPAEFDRLGESES